MLCFSSERVTAIPPNRPHFARSRSSSRDRRRQEADRHRARQVRAADAESEQGYTGKHLGPSVPGRPISVGAKARPFTLRLDAARRAKLDEVAHERDVTPSQLMRDLIDFK